MKKPKIFIACDTNKISKVKKIIAQTKTNKLDIGYKFGLEFFYSKGGREYISKIKGKKIFLDLKLNDIPATCSAALKSLKDLRNINYITLHANAGEETIKTVVKLSKKKIGHTRSIKEIVKRQASLAKSCRCHGIVCAGSDLNYVKKIFKGEIITPGIRLKGDSAGDQKRIMGPKEAFKNGSTALVMGRSIINQNIKTNIKKLILELK